MTDPMDGMMFGMTLLWLIVIIALVLAAAALIKYLFFSGGHNVAPVSGGDALRG